MSAFHLLTLHLLRIPGACGSRLPPNLLLQLLSFFFWEVLPFEALALRQTLCFYPDFLFCVRQFRFVTHFFLGSNSNVIRSVTRLRIQTGETAAFASDDQGKDPLAFGARPTGALQQSELLRLLRSLIEEPLREQRVLDGTHSLVDTPMVSYSLPN
jgi:hypothetical protein